MIGRICFFVLVATIIGLLNILAKLMDSDSDFAFFYFYFNAIAISGMATWLLVLHGLL